VGSSYIIIKEKKLEALQLILLYTGKVSSFMPTAVLCAASV
jgi:hypothetical protein